MKERSSQMQFQAPLFDPWVGLKYGHDGVKKIMVVGASHYCQENGCDVNRCPSCTVANSQCRGMTQRVINDYLESPERDGWTRTYTKFINSLYGRNATQEERSDVFDHVVFMNYLQRVEGCFAEEKHNEFFREQCHFHAFCYVVLRYRPDVVIVWGDRVWMAILDSICDNEPDMDYALAKGGWIADIRINDIKFKLLEVYHPSYFRYESADNPNARFKKFDVTFPLH